MAGETTVPQDNNSQSTQSLEHSLHNINRVLCALVDRLSTIENNVSSCAKILPKDIPGDIQFCGKFQDNACSFMDRFQLFTKYMSLTNPEICKLFPLTLTDRAYQWYKDLSLSITNDWDELKNAFLKQYGPTSRGFVFETNLLDRSQGDKESVDTYVNDLDRRFAILDIKDPQKWKTFVGGLKPSLKAHVLRHDFKTFHEAEILAKQGEQLQTLVPDITETISALLEKVNSLQNEQSNPNRSPITNNSLESTNFLEPLCENCKSTEQSRPESVAVLRQDNHQKSNNYRFSSRQREHNNYSRKLHHGSKYQSSQRKYQNRSSGHHYNHTNYWNYGQISPRTCNDSNTHNYNHFYQQNQGNC